MTCLTPIILFQRRGFHGAVMVLAATGFVVLRIDCPFAKLWGGQPPAIGMGEAVEHQADRGQGNHRLGDLG